MTDTAWSRLGRVGIRTFAFDVRPADRVRDAAAEMERAGYGAIRFGGAFGRDTADHACREALTADRPSCPTVSGANRPRSCRRPESAAWAGGLCPGDRNRAI
ncbi:hypothetical protein [Kitasatospora sp. NBC_01560]|uniref:hypothetical protein n=1 Tax=Kitasatospora sp. NBC_01560 TaxID=2975965 RepID=UPI00386DAF63